MREYCFRCCFKTSKYKNEPQSDMGSKTATSGETTRCSYYTVLPILRF